MCIGSRLFVCFIITIQIVNASTSAPGSIGCINSIFTETTSQSIAINIGKINLTNFHSAYVELFVSLPPYQFKVKSNTFQMNLLAYTYTGLNPGTKYIFDIYLNQTGSDHNGSPSCIVPHLTRPGNPNCDLLTTTDVTNSSFTVNLSFIDIGAEYYELSQHSLINSSISRKIMIPKDDQLYNVADLQPGNTYTFYLRGIGEDGQRSEKNCSFNVVTRPNNPICDVVIFSKTQLTMLEIATNQHIPSGATGFRVISNTSHPLPSVTPTQINGVINLTLQNLDPGVVYTIVLYSVGRAGLLSEGFCKLQQATCSSMLFENISFTALNSSALFLSFSMPALRNKTNIQFIIGSTYRDHLCVSQTYNAKFNMTKFQISVAHGSRSYSNQWSYTYTHLYSNWEYLIRIKPAICEGLGSEWSKPVVGKTTEAVPGHIDVSSVQFSNITTTSVTISWNVPCYPNGVISGYDIDIANFKSYKTTADETNITISDLHSHTQYRVSISALNSIGAGPGTVFKAFRTQQDGNDEENETFTVSTNNAQIASDTPTYDTQFETSLSTKAPTVDKSRLCSAPGNIRRLDILTHNYTETFPYILVTWETPDEHGNTCKIRGYYIVYWLDTFPSEKKILRTVNTTIKLPVFRNELYTIQKSQINDFNFPSEEEMKFKKVFAESFVNGSKVGTTVYVTEEERAHDNSPDVQENKKTDLTKIEAICGVFGAAILTVLIILTIVCVRRRKTDQIPSNIQNILRGYTDSDIYDEIKERSQRRSPNDKNGHGIHPNPVYEKVKENTHKRTYDSVVNRGLEDPGTRTYHILEKRSNVRKVAPSENNQIDHDYIDLVERQPGTLGSLNSDYEFVQTSEYQT